jgi:uncharacterized protein
MSRFSYTADMKHEFAALPLDPRAFAQSCGKLSGNESLTRYERIAQDCQHHGQGATVAWSARGEMRADHLGHEEIWLHLHADASAPMICQRCLEVVDIALRVDRSFRFVADEETAAAQDDDVPEDLLVLAGELDLQQLIEDELVLELPLIARHEICPTQPPASASDSDFGIAVAGRPNPFAVLAQLKPAKGDRED